jgi:hypothetical protein
MAKDGKMSMKAPVVSATIKKANLADAPVKSNGDSKIKGGRPSHVNK